MSDKKCLQYQQLRVLQAPGGSAGQPYCIAKALNDLGLFAHSLRLGTNKFEYPANIILPKNDINSYCDALTKYADDYDVFHFHFRPFFYTNAYCSYPMGMDILSLRAAGKIVVLHFRGSEIRLHSVFKNASPYNYVSENPNNIILKFPEEAQRSYIRLMKAICNEVIVTDPELLTYCPGAKIVPRAIDLNDWEYVGVSDSNNPPLIVHAPSRRIVKGTDILIEVLEQLRQEGFHFKLKLVENLSHAEAKEVYKNADIVVDQLRIGWYGVLSVEAMAMGKLVVAYIRDDLQKYLFPSPPLLMTNPENLKKDLQRAISDLNFRKEMSVRARDYVSEVHDSQKVGLKLISIYNECIANSTCLNFSVLGDYINNQAFYKKPLNIIANPKKIYSCTKQTILQKLLDCYYQFGFSRTVRIVCNKILTRFQ